MVYKTFNEGKVKRFINGRGSTYKFKKMVLNEFNEPTYELNQTYNVVGVFHVEHSKEHIIVTVNDAGNVQTKPTPKIFCLVEHAENVEQGDLVEIKGSTFRVTGKENLADLDIAVDISLELINNGSNI